MGNCTHCGAPMIELFMPGSLVCKAECDLNPKQMTHSQRKAYIQRKYPNVRILSADVLGDTNPKDIVSADPDYSNHPVGSGEWAYDMLQAGHTVCKRFAIITVYYRVRSGQLQRQSTFNWGWKPEPFPNPNSWAGENGWSIVLDWGQNSP